MTRFRGCHAGAGSGRAAWFVGLKQAIHVSRYSVLACVAASAVAQGLPPAVDPGRLRERFDVPVPPAAGVSLPAFKGSPGDSVPEALRAVRVTLHKIIVDGATVFTADEMSRFTAPYLGRELSGADIFALAQALTVHYRNTGYFLSVVVVPPQSLDDNTLTLRVIEGYIAAVHIEGDARVVERLAELADKIRASRPLQAQTLERYLLLANDLPGVQVRSVLSPSRTVGAADLTLVASVKEVEGFVSVDNYGSRYLGPNQATLGLSVNQLLGGNDQLRFVGVGTGDTEMSYAQLGYTRVLDDEGVSVGLTLSQARTRPGDSLQPFDIRGRSDTASLSLSVPLRRTRNESVFMRLVYDNADIDTDILGSRTTQDRIRAVRAGLSWQLLDRLDGQNTLDLDLSQGLGGTTATDLLKSRQGADGNFNKLTFEYTRFQPWSAQWGLALGLAGQWTESQPLLSSEQFALGGRRYGRAYEPAELVGDRGMALRLEPRYSGVTGDSWLRAYHLLAFWDVGEVSKVGARAAGTPISQSLASAGLGTRLFFTGNVAVQAEVAWPLTKELASAPQDGKAARWLGSVLVRF